MIKNYLLVTIRNLKRNSIYTFINIFGLAIGLSAGFLILQYVHYEMSYDEFFENKENIYRVQLNRYNNGELSTQWAAGCAGAGLAMKEDFPEVIEFVNLIRSQAEISYNNRYFELSHPYYAGDKFFTVFSVPLIQGVDSLVLKEPFTVVLSETTARKIFGDEDPMGKVILTNDRNQMVVTGIYKDLPENSHMKFDLLYSFETYVALVSEDARTAWQWDGFLNYVKLYPGTNSEVLERKFPDFVQAREGEALEQYNSGMEFILQPLTEIHLTSNYRGEIKPTGNQRTTYFLLIIGLFVLVIAWINYINLTTARSMGRAREVGIRKVVGSKKAQLVNQFLFESFFINLVALSIATLLVLICFPYFNDFIGRSLRYTWPDTMIFWGAGLLVFFAGVLLSGFYPAIVLTRFKPVVVLRGQFSGSQSGNFLRKGLVVSQFLASVILITGTFVVFKQMNFLRDQDLGVNITQTLVIESPNYQSDSVLISKDQLFRDRLNAESSVQAITTSTAVPGRTPAWNAGGIRLITKSEKESNQYRVLGGDDQFLDFYGLEVIAGRKFDRSFSTEPANVLFNEAALNRIGLNDPEEIINKKIYFWGDTMTVVGVVKNYRQESPKSAYDAIVFRYFESPSGYYSIRITGNMSQTIETVRTHWETAFNSKPFDFFFLDDYYNEQYTSEMKFGSIFGWFSGLAIVVACMGLFGLASFTTNLRTKEISVRKVLGARTVTLWQLLTSEFLKLVGLSILIALPINWWLIRTWLDNFEERISVGLDIYLFPGLILAMIAVLTVSFHTYRLTRINPARTLKTE